MFKSIISAAALATVLSATVSAPVVAQEKKNAMALLLLAKTIAPI